MPEPLDLNIFNQKNTFYPMAHKKRSKRATKYCPKCHESHYTDNWVHTAVGAVVGIAVLGAVLGAASNFARRT